MKQRNKKIAVTRYEMFQVQRDPCTIAMVSDLHDQSFETVIKLLKQEQPDVILAAGDIMERCDEAHGTMTMAELDRWQGISRKNRFFYGSVRVATNLGRLFLNNFPTQGRGLEFLQEASKIAPVFYGTGNHEWYFEEEDYTVFSDNHIQLLDNQDVKYFFHDRMIRIGSLSTRYDLEWLDRYSEKDGEKILICHHPEYYRRFIKETRRDQFSLVLSGHVHGGQWRIGNRGVLGPGQGLFPTYCYGLYDGKMIVGAGLSNTAGVPRFGNPPELVIIHF